MLKRWLIAGSLALLAGSFALGGCDHDDVSSSDSSGSNEVSAPSLLGNWESKVSTVTLTATFAGSPESGTATLVQSISLSGDTPTCRADYVDTGTFQVTGQSVTITVTDAKQRTSGCSFPDTEQPADKQAGMNFAGALSGPFIVTETSLRLGASYPQFTRK